MQELQRTGCSIPFIGRKFKALGAQLPRMALHMNYPELVALQTMHASI